MTAANSLQQTQHVCAATACYAVQEACALRFLQGRNAAPHGGLVKLSSAFTYCGHVCLVLERLHGSLLDYVVHSASLCKPQALQNLRKIAVQLLVTQYCCRSGSNILLFGRAVGCGPGGGGERRGCYVTCLSSRLGYVSYSEVYLIVGIQRQ